GGAGEGVRRRRKGDAHGDRAGVTMKNFKIETDSDGVALVTFDVPGRSMNTLTFEVIGELGELVERIKSDPAIKGAVITSGKTTGFCAGADLGDIGAGLSSAASQED